jgi:hypothetical protein
MLGGETDGEGEADALLDADDDRDDDVDADPVRVGAEVEEDEAVTDSVGADDADPV